MSSEPIDSKTILIVAVAAVIVAGGAGAAILLTGDSGSDREITFHGNGYTTSDGKSSVTLTGDKAVRVDFVSDLQLRGWNTRDDGTGTAYAIDATVADGVKDLYAQYVGTIEYSNFAGTDRHYGDVDITISTVFNGETSEWDVSSDLATYVENGRDTEITIRSTVPVTDVFAQNGQLLFYYEDGTIGSFQVLCNNIAVVETTVLGDGATIGLTGTANGRICLERNVLKAGVSVINNVPGTHVELFASEFDESHIITHDIENILLDDSTEMEFRLVVDGNDAHVTGWSRDGPSFSYRIGSQTSGTIYYRITSDGGFVGDGELVGDQLHGYADYLKIPFFFATSGCEFNPVTSYTISLGLSNDFTLLDDLRYKVDPGLYIVETKKVNTGSGWSSVTETFEVLAREDQQVTYRYTLTNTLDHSLDIDTEITTDKSYFLVACLPETYDPALHPLATQTEKQYGNVTCTVYTIDEDVPVDIHSEVTTYDGYILKKTDTFDDSQYTDTYSIRMKP